VSVGLQDLFGPEDRARLTSGFVTRVLVRVALQEEGSTQPVALAFQRTEIVYDIWDERFRLRITRGAGPDVHLEARTSDEAIARAAALWDFPVAEAAPLRRGTSYVLASAATSIRSPRSCSPTCGAGSCSRRAASGASARATASSARS